MISMNTSSFAHALSELIDWKQCRKITQLFALKIIDLLIHKKDIYVFIHSHNKKYEYETIKIELVYR